MSFFFSRKFAFLFRVLAGWKLGFWGNVVFSDETRVCLNRDSVVQVIRKTGHRFCPKNTQRLSTDKKSMMFWGPSQLRIFGDFKAIRSTFEYTGFDDQTRQRPSTQK